MMVGTFGLLLGGASTSHMQTVQVVPVNGSYSQVIMIPIETCQAGQYAFGYPASAWPSDPKNGPDAQPAAIACPNPDFYYGQDPSANVTYIPVPCCGG